MSVAQLRDKITQMLDAAGQDSMVQKSEYLNQFIAKWSMNNQAMTHQQFIGALQSLHLPLYGAGEVFAALDRDKSGYVDVREFCDAMISPLPQLGSGTQSRQATRNAGSQILMSGKQDERFNRIATSPPISERGYTPTRPSAQTTPRGSRIPQPQLTGTLKPPSASRNAATSRPRPNRAATTDVDFSDIVISKFREIVLNRGGSSGIHSLGRIFRIMDDDRNRRISLDELSSGLQDYGLNMGSKDLQLLMAAIDKDNTGGLTFDEFLMAVRGVVNKRRQSLINMAFDVLDATGDGQIQVDDIASCFDAKGHPDVRAGTLPEEQALGNFLSQFDGVDQNGTVTRQEFLEYYRNVSASIDDDDYFELMIRNAWHIAGGTGQYQNTSNTRVLVTLVDGTQKVVRLEHDLGLDMRNAAAVKAALRDQGVANVVSFSTAS